MSEDTLGRIARDVLCAAKEKTKRVVDNAKPHLTLENAQKVATLLLTVVDIGGKIKQPKGSS